MMKYKPSQAYYKEFTTARFSSGAAYDATGTPVVTANKNGTDDAAFVLTAANIDTGRYRITGTVPAGYADGDIVNVTVAATVDAVAAKANVDTFLVVTSREADIYARVGAPAGASIAADLLVIDNFVDDLETRCTEARLAELDAANLPTDVAAVKGDTAAVLLDTGTDGVVLPVVERFYSESGQAQSGAVGSVTLRSGASATSDLFIGQKISIYAGTGAGQTRGIANYNGTSKVATVARNWTTAPDATSMYRVDHDFGPKVDNALTVTTGTNNDKTGYSLTQSFPSNFASLSITAGGLVDITQAAADKVWGTAARTLTSFGTLVADVWGYATRLLTAGTNIALAKGTGVTGFNDIAAADVWAVATRALTDKAGFELSAAGVDAILDDVVEGTLTLRQVMRINLAALAGKSSGGGTATLLFTGADGTTTRITATVDANGNRTAVTVSGV